MSNDAAMDNANIQDLVQLVFTWTASAPATTNVVSTECNQSKGTKEDNGQKHGIGRQQQQWQQWMTWQLRMRKWLKPQQQFWDLNKWATFAVKGVAVSAAVSLFKWKFNAKCRTNFCWVAWRHSGFDLSQWCWHDNCATNTSLPTPSCSLHTQCVLSHALNLAVHPFPIWPFVTQRGFDQKTMLLGDSPTVTKSTPFKWTSWWNVVANHKRHRPSHTVLYRSHAIDPFCCNSMAFPSSPIWNHAWNQGN